MMVWRGPGRLIAVVGPSGVGKDTILQGAVQADPDLVLARRIITRPQSAGGEDFEGVSQAQFDARLALDEFAFHWRAHGLRYAIPRSINSDLAAGRTVLFNGSRKALDLIRKAYPRVVVVMITAPEEVLARRLAARGRETRADIAARLERAGLGVPEGAIIVRNDGTVEQGVAAFLAAVTRTEQSV